jgi:hypothetical protein
MNNASRRSLIVFPIVVLIGAFVAWAGSQGSYTFRGIPVFAVCIALAFVLQWIAFIPAYILQTEKFYDLMGSITYLSVAWIAVLLSPFVDARSWLLVGIASICPSPDEHLPHRYLPTRTINPTQIKTSSS